MVSSEVRLHHRDRDNIIQITAIRSLARDAKHSGHSGNAFSLTLNIEPCCWELSPVTARRLRKPKSIGLTSKLWSGNIGELAPLSGDLNCEKKQVEITKNQVEITKNQVEITKIKLRLPNIPKWCYSEIGGGF